MNLKAFLFIAILAVSTSLTAAKGDLPVAQSIQGKAKSLNHAITRMFVSADFEVPKAIQQMVVASADPVQVEVDAIIKLMKNPAPASAKAIRFVRYTLGDKRMTEALIRAHKAGIRVEMTVDLNPMLDGKFASDDESFNSNFDEASLKKNPDGHLTEGAEAISQLTQAGFKFGTQILSQPLYNPKFKADRGERRIPILHEKYLATLVQGGDEFFYFGTANTSSHPRYNRVFETSDPDIIQTYLDHIDQLNAVYRAGHETSAIVDNIRRVITYKDGTSVDIAFTDGQHNPNQRIVETVTNHQGQMIKAMKAIFADTYRPELEAYRAMLKQNKNAVLFLLADEKFSRLNEWGIIPAAVGFDVVAPFGKYVAGFERPLIDRVFGYVYLRPTQDASGEDIHEDADDLSGPPDKRHLMHDKTTVLIYKDGDTTFAEIFTGSFNSSNNIANADGQAQMKVPADSWLSVGIQESMNQIVQREPEYALWAPFAILRGLLADVYDRSPLDIPNEITHDFIDAAFKRDLPAIEKIFSQLSSRQKNKDPKIIQDRIDRAVNFFKWYAEKFPDPSKDYTEFRLRRLMCILLLVSKPIHNDYYNIHLFRQIIWRPDMTDADLRAKIHEAGKILNIPVNNDLIRTDSDQAPDLKSRFEVKEENLKQKLQSVQAASASSCVTSVKK